ncbi:hypothetical protein AB832_00325 [Flavobacteriaceae bacterium (ex Bugula neritina AB1)]|nr:hypothetical protein AB832_00325 [Flavobacteriaceae bacterium (ex Bugula neritina AB1)]
MTKKQYHIVIFNLLIFLSIPNIEGQTLLDYKNEAEQNNPELKAIQSVYNASLERSGEVGNLPNTVIGAGYFVSEPETRTGAQKAKFNVQQKLPWFGTIKARKEISSAESEVLKSKLEIAKRKLMLQVESTYYNLYELKAKQRVLIKQDTLIGKYLEIGYKEVENNRATAVDILKLNIARNKLHNKKEILKGKTLSAETKMNQLLHRDGFDPLFIPNNLIIPDEEPTMILDDITYHPELMTYDYMEEVLGKKEKANVKEALPSIGLGLDYIVVQERPDMSFSDNGKDIVMPMISFSVPLFSTKYSARKKQYELQKEEVYQRREASQNQLEILMEEAINNRITARINYDTQQKNSKQAEQAAEIILSGYQTAQLDFEEMLDIQKMILNFEIKKIEAIALYFKQTAILNYLR